MLGKHQKALLMAVAILLALLPLIELVDHWEAYGSDPEFVSVCTVVGIALGFVLLFHHAIHYLVRRPLPTRFSLGQSAVAIAISLAVVPTASPPIPAPIRI